MKIILFILIFSLIVMVHEFGHFLLAKKNGIYVTEFSLGLGPTLVGFTKGETKYSLKLLPFGGACMFLGEDGVSTDSRAFPNQSVFARISVVAAGPIFNFILAFICSLFIIGGIGYDAPVIYQVVPNFPAAEAGLKEGDKIVKMNDTRIHIYREVSMYVQMHQNQTVDVTYERDGKQTTVTLDPKYSEDSGYYLLGFLGAGTRVKGNALTTIEYSAYEVKYWIDTTIKSLGMLIKGKISADDLSGPVGVAQIVGKVYDNSKADGAFYVWLNMLNIAVLLSANLGVMNLLPLPALDGGRLVFLVIEAIRRKRIDPEKEGMVHFIGLMLLMLLMVFVMFNDIRKLF